MKSPLPLLALLLAVVGSVAAARRPSEEVLFRWKGKNYTTASLPEELPITARKAVDAFAGWAEQEGYRMDLDAEGRVLFITHGKNKRYARQVKLIDKVLDFFESSLPPPERRSEEEKEAPPPPTRPQHRAPDAPEDGPLPEDPEEAGHPWDDVDWGEEEGYTYWYTSYSWGAGGVPLDTETIVFVNVWNQTDYDSLLRFLVGEHAYLKEWYPAARKVAGFALQQPLAGCYIENPDGVEEWNPDNELANRLGQLLVYRRFGQLPYWLVQGWAWVVEMRILKGVYVFPYRDEFVWAVEHTSWNKSVRGYFTQRKKDELLEPKEFVMWKRGVWRDFEAKMSWGVVDYLVRERNRVLPAMFERLRAFRDADNRIAVDENNWVRKPGYEIPAAEQERIMNEFLGAGIWAEMTAAFRKM